MTKGKKCLPLLTNDGIWFRHSRESGGMEEPVPDTTSTRAMLEASLSAPLSRRNPPAGYSQKEKPSYKIANPFSNHDNRHTIQGKAEYLGNGCDTRCFGRRLHPIDRRLHHTDVTFFYQGSTNSAKNYGTTTATTFGDPGPIEPLTNRRFPKIYRNAEISDSMSETLGRCTSSYRTPLHVLAMSQQPFLNRNTWKYSYQGDHRVYPPYNRNKIKFI